MVGLRHCLPGRDNAGHGNVQIPPSGASRAYLSRARWSSHSAGGSTARSKSVTWLGRASSRMSVAMDAKLLFYKAVFKERLGSTRVPGKIATDPRWQAGARGEARSS